MNKILFKNLATLVIMFVISFVLSELSMTAFYVLLTIVAGLCLLTLVAMLTGMSDNIKGIKYTWKSYWIGVLINLSGPALTLIIQLIRGNVL